MTDQSSFEQEFDSNRSLCSSCAFGLCGLKLSLERNEIKGELFDGPPLGDQSSFPVDEDPALAAHREEYQTGPKRNPNITPGDDSIEQTSGKYFIHGICAHPMLAEQVHVPIVLDCNRYEEDSSIIDEDDDESPEE